MFDASRTPQQNLGAAARAGITDLEADRSTGEFELVIARVSRRVLGGMDHHTVARVVQRERAPGTRIVASLMLLEGIFRETVDEE